MTFYEYQEEAIKTVPKEILENKHLAETYCKLKFLEEIGEIAEMVAKHYFHNTPFDKENLLEEIGDLYWYIALFLYPYTNDIPFAYMEKEKDFDIKNELLRIANSTIAIMNIKTTNNTIVAVKILGIQLEKLLVNYDYSLQDCWKYNINKLRKRHGEKYNQSHYDQYNSSSKKKEDVA